MIARRFLNGLLVAVSATLVAGAAQAATYSYTYNYSPVPVGNVSPYDATDLVNAAVVSGWDDDEYHIPYGVGEQEEYLSVYGNGSAKYSFALGTTQVAFDWGSIDYYNYITVTNFAGDSYSIKGGALLDNPDSLGRNATDPGLGGSGTVSAYFTLSDADGIKEIVLGSGLNSFEEGRMSAVPLPAAALLFGSGIVALAGIRRKKATA